MPTNLPIAENIAHIQQLISAAAASASRDPAEVHLIAVSKTKPLSAVTAAVAAGQHSFGENYAQELADKATGLAADWHFIGPLQSNKTKLVANAASWVHTIDRPKIAERLNAQRDPKLPTLQCCIQVNISEDPNKSGLTPAAVAELADAFNAWPNLQLRGLMCIPSAEDHDAFARMQQLFNHLKQQGFCLDTLSMGMSNDFELAIAHGATHVRVGTAIFGARETNPQPIGKS